jgi:hypothetical protein
MLANTPAARVSGLNHNLRLTSGGRTGIELDCCDLPGRDDRRWSDHDPAGAAYGFEEPQASAKVGFMRNCAEHSTLRHRR